MADLSTIDTTKLPIVIITIYAVETSDEEMEAHLDKMFQLYTRHKSIVVIFDMTQAKYLKSSHRIRQGNWLKQHNELMKGSLLGAAYLTKSVMAKLILQGIFLVKKPDWPNKITESMDEALAWANNLIANSR